MGEVATLARTLDQELVAIFRGVSLECLVCGEFLQHLPGGSISCPECGSGLRFREPGRCSLHEHAGTIGAQAG